MALLIFNFTESLLRLVSSLNITKYFAYCLVFSYSQNSLSYVNFFFPKKYGKFACTSAYWWDSYPRHPVKTNFSWFVFHPVSTKSFWSSKCNFTVDDKEMLNSNKIYYCYIGQAVRLYKGSCKFLFKVDMSQESFDFIYLVFSWSDLSFNTVKAQ